jgi:undecaprenyl phosphate-alpha-L-ara4FN deformylase
MMHLGLRVDVDTFRGTRLGVPNLLCRLDEARVKATFFFSVGPDNMGRHLWRLLRPVFLWKMLRSRAASLYGWDILLRGTFGPGPRIGVRLSWIIQDTERAGHEVGLHAWDHYHWQTHIERLKPEQIDQALKKGVEELTRTLGHVPVCSAVPAWRCTDAVLEAKDQFGFEYNSDCRGTRCFWPLVRDRALSQAQVPVTLPTYDELIGCDGVTDETYNAVLFDRIRPGVLNVLTIHAEVEGGAKQGLFARFLAEARLRGIEIMPLGRILKLYPAREYGLVRPIEMPGRDGWLAQQQEIPLDSE